MRSRRARLSTTTRSSSRGRPRRRSAPKPSEGLSRASAHMSSPGLTGRPSTPRQSFLNDALWNTGCPSCAGHDDRVQKKKGREQSRPFYFHRFAALIASEAKQSSLFAKQLLDCFVALLLAMTAERDGLLRRLRRLQRRIIRVAPGSTAVEGVLVPFI